MPETPKDPPRNFPAGASPSPDWQRCLFSFFTMRSSSNSRIPDFQSGNAGASPAGRTIFPSIHHTAGVSLRSEVSKSSRVRGSTGTPCQFSPYKQRSSQVVRQRFHTPRIAGSNPASATSFQKSRARESANPPRLERGGTRGSTGARDHFPTILRSSIAEHPPDKRTTAARYRAEGPFPGDVKAACPSVKRDVVVQVHAGEPWLCS